MIQSAAQWAASLVLLAMAITTATVAMEILLPYRTAYEWLRFLLAVGATVGMVYLAMEFM